MSATYPEVPALAEGFSVRRIEPQDYDNGALDVLKGLTTVGDISKSEFCNLISTWNANPQIYHTLVVVAPSGKVAAIGSIVVEAKLIHSCGKVGHIEDIAVDKTMRGSHLGLTMIRHLLEFGSKAGCYKVILDCDPENEAFYIKCGLSRAGLEMQYRYN